MRQNNSILASRIIEKNNAPLLLILHGLYGSSQNWRGTSSILKEDFSIHMVDLPNHGISPSMDSMSYADQAKRLFDYFRAMNIDQAAVLGHSMGGKTALQFAHDYPGMTTKLIIADIAPRPYKPQPVHLQIAEALKKSSTREFVSRKEADETLRPYIHDEINRKFLLTGLRKTGNGTFKFHAGMPFLYKHLDKIFKAPDLKHTIHTPSLFIKGENSSYIKNEDTDRLNSCCADWKLKTIKGAGHLLHIDRKAEFAKTCRDFLIKPGD